MQTHFTDTQLQDPQIREADGILRKCVHCGFCTATCPTFVMTGDERDSPRGRIWMMRELLESPDSISADTGHHIDRCLGCLSCMTFTLHSRRSTEPARHAGHLSTSAGHLSEQPGCAETSTAKADRTRDHLGARAKRVAGEAVDKGRRTRL